MKLVSLLKNNLTIPEVLKNELSILERQIPENFTYRNTTPLSDIAVNFQKTIELQKESADRRNHLTFGFDALNNALLELEQKQPVFMNMIESENWGGRVYFNDEYILLGIFIGKKHNKNWETPPNWDGSHDMLQRYNERFKKD